ncbi:hypothetical protein [Candidatus Lucifugimonas marina]|uniref:hypothetical protein n=1 Tax=Candidatus Lucifugimonas marina TaxID=3038979 RepID=UPI00319E74F3
MTTFSNWMLRGTMHEVAETDLGQSRCLDQHLESFRTLFVWSGGNSEEKSNYPSEYQVTIDLV